MDPLRKQEAEESASPSLPNDLIEDIFARMPAKSAQRCRCLSRAWAAALSSPAFVDLHLRLANRRDGSRSRSLFFLPDPDSGADTTVHAWSPGRPLVPVLSDERLRRVAAVTRQCRGLVVLEAKGENLVYNPSTGQITALPEGKEAFGVWPHNRAMLALGYDTGIRKHKVVRLYCRGKLPPACEVYVLDSVGHWRPPVDKTLPPARATDYSTDQSVFAQGHVYWAAKPHKAYPGEKVIMSFSMAHEVFGILPLPAMDTEHWRITELGGLLCLFEDITAVCSFDIWVLREPPAGTWDLHCRINLDVASPAATQLKCSTSIIPLDIAAGGGSRVLLRPEPRNIQRENSEEHQLVSYDSETGDVEDLLVGGGMITHHTVARRPVAPYEESLESTGRPHQDIIFCSTFSQALALVLRLLPARTLGQLKCVCRSWCAMIETDRFIKMHYEHAARSSLPRIVLCSIPYNRPFASLDSCLKHKSLTLAGRIQLLQSRVVSSKPCHGLLLVSHDKYAQVCNPVTGTRVLHSDLPFEKPSKNVAAAARPGCAGLGYDVSREEHVIVVLAYTSFDFYTRTYAMECSVRRLASCVTRKVSSPPPIPVTIDVPPVYAAGMMYWMGEPRLGTGCSSILAFDICNETFHVLPAPHIIDGSGSGRMLVAELSGQIRIVHTCPDTETMTIWGFGNGRGWTREHSIQLEQWPEFSPRMAAGLVVPLAIDGLGRILLDTGRALGYYNPSNQTLETVVSTSNWQSGGFSGFFSAALCEDSLVRPYDRQRG